MVRTKCVVIEPHELPHDPGGEKRSPASVGAERGADRKNSNLVSRKHTTKQPQQAQESDRSLSVYDGRIRIANIFINVTGDEFTVVLADGAQLGRFKTLTQASAAISAAQGGER